MHTHPKHLSDEHLKVPADRSKTRHQTIPKPAKDLWHHLCNFLSLLFHDPSQPLIKEKRDRYGRLYWKVFDSRTGNYMVCDSKQEVCAWIEEHWFRDRC